MLVTFPASAPGYLGSAAVYSAPLSESIVVQQKPPDGTEQPTSSDSARAQFWSGKFEPKPEEDKDSEIQKMIDEEKASNRSLKAFFAVASVLEGTVRGLAQLGNFWGLLQGIMGATPSGWTAVWAGMGSALTITDNAWQTKVASVNRNVPAAVDGTLGMVQGFGVLLTAMGLGRIPALISLGAGIGRVVYAGYNAVREAREAKEARDEIKEKQKQKQQQAQQPAPAPAPAPPAPTLAPPPAPAPPVDTKGIVSLACLMAHVV